MTGRVKTFHSESPKSPSSQDVAARAGVSQSTVSRAINGVGSVRPANRARIERAMAELGYVPNAAARSLITRRTGLLGLVVSNVTNAFYPEIIDAITTAAMQSGYSVIIGSAREDPNSQAALLGLLAQHRAEGVILTSTLMGDLPESHSPSGLLPIVLVNRVRDDLSWDSVALDNAGAGELATHHLVKHGRRRIAYVGGREDAPTDRARFAGYLRALGRAGIDISPELIAHGEFTHGFGKRFTSQLIASGQPFNGIVAGDDTVALGCLDALADAGVDVPEDVGVVGFDDIPAADLRAVSLTTVSSRAHEMGTRALGLLLDRIRDGFDRPPRRIVIPPRLIVRNSCGLHVASKAKAAR